MTQDAPIPVRRKRWWPKILAALVLLALIAVAAIPQLLSTAAARRIIVARINASIAPGRVEVERFQFSWTGSTRMQGVQIEGEHGEAIVSAPSAVWDRSLWQLATHRPHYGTMTLVGAKLDLERQADGTINLTHALGLDTPTPPPTAPPAAPGPAAAPSPEITLKIVGGSLRLRSPELLEPLIAGRLDMTADVPAMPAPVTWKIALAEAKTAQDAALEIDGSLARGGAAPADLSLDLVAKRWPLAVAESGTHLRGMLDGKLDLTRKAGLLGLAGDARMLDLEATGPALAGDRVQMAQLGGTWSLGQSTTGWTVRQLNVECPVASLVSKGSIPAEAGADGMIEGKVDLAALAQQAPHALRLRDGLTLQKGAALFRVVVKEQDGGQRLDVAAKLSDLVAREASRPAAIVLRDPAVLSAELLTHGRAVRVEKLGIKSEWLAAEGSGDLEKGVKLAASFDLDGLEKQLRDFMDLSGVDLAGKGEFSADYKREKDSYAATVAGEMRNLKVVGVTSSPIEREHVKLSAHAEGAADVTGLPVSWRVAKVVMGSPEMSASAQVATRDGGYFLVVSTAMRVQPAGRSDLHVAGLWKDAALRIDELHASYTPKDPKARISLAAKGVYDRSQGTLALLPFAGTDPVRIAPKGLNVSGMAGAGPIAVEGEVDGDLAVVDRALAAYLGSPPHDLEGPMALAMVAKYDGKVDRLDLTGATLATQYATLGIGGPITEVSTRRMADLNGNLILDPKTIDRWVVATIAPDARVAATARPIHVKGPLSGEILKTIEAEAGLDLANAQASGMRLGPAAIVVHVAGGKATIDPIKSTLNDGTVEIRSEMTLDDPKGMAFRLLPGTSIKNASIDEEVSRRLLTYIAPILNDASQVRGNVSLELERAEFPIGGDANRQVTMAGQLDFINLVFGPGPAAREILDVVALKREPELKLNEAIKFAVSDRRVYQRGLSIPVGKGDKVDISGSVGFDKTLALDANLPLPTGDLAKRAGLDVPPGNERISLPIGGTISRPRVDRRGLARAMKGEGGKILQREAEKQVDGLLKNLLKDAKRR